MPARQPLLAAFAALALAPAVLGAAEGGRIKTFNEPTQDYLEHKAQLEEMLTSRDVDLFEMAFDPLALDRVVMTPRVGTPYVLHYLTFRLRNKITDDTKALTAKATRYNELLAAIAEQYEDAKVTNGVTLEVAGENVLDRAELRARTRKVSLTVYAYDEDGSRLRLLDDPVGSGPQENYNFADHGEVEAGAASRQAREKVEEIVGRRLMTVDEIRTLELPPYDASKVNDYGEAEGEVFGVILIDRLNDHGDRFTIEVRGLNNKIRIRQPDSVTGTVDNYLASRVLRRVYVLNYSRPGDEFFRDQDRFVLADHGWEWLNTFQRLDQRKNVAYARYFLNNIADDQNKPVQSVEDEFWPYYDAVREAKPDAGDKLPDLQSALKQGK